MPKKLLQKALTCLLLWGPLFAHLACQTEKKDHQTGLREETRKADARIEFYGKVLDQKDQPVEGADVVLQLARFSPNPASFFMAVDQFNVKTDARGCFSIIGRKGRKLSVVDLKKENYEYLRIHGSQTSFEYDPGVRDLFKPDPKNPKIFRLREMGEAMFLIKGAAGFHFETNETNTRKGRDFIREFSVDEKGIANPQYLGEPLVCDLIAKATWDVKSQSWTATLSVGTPEGGILASDQILFEAPENGYQPTVNLGPKLKTGKMRYLYIRSRKPFIYSRLDLGMDFDVHGRPFVRSTAVQGPFDKSNWFEIGGSVVTNPYGGRNLEAALDLPFEITHPLREKVKASYRFNPNGRPPTPDLPKLIQEWEKSRPLSDKLKKRLIR